jgi:hypothetical protein
MSSLPSVRHCSHVISLPVPYALQEYKIRGQVYAHSGLSLGSSLFWDVTQRRLVLTDFSGQPIGPILKSQAVRGTSVTIYLLCVTSQKSGDVI